MKKSIIVIIIIVLTAVVGIGGIYLVKPELINNLFNNSSINEPDTPAIPDLSNAVVTDTKITDRVKYAVGALLSGGKISNPTFSNSMGYAFITYGTIDKDTLKISDESKRVIALNGALESRSLMTEEVATKMKKTLESYYGIGYETNEKIASPVGRDYVLDVKSVRDMYTQLFGENMVSADINLNCPFGKYDSDAKMYLLSYACGGGDGAPLLMYGIRDIKKSGEYIIANVEVAKYADGLTYAGYGIKDNYTSSDMISTGTINLGDENDIYKKILHLVRILRNIK